jgi:SOS-response transcriptional repressor LexA
MGRSTNDTQGMTQRDRMMEFIKEYIKMNSYPPSIREIKEALHYNTNSAPFYHLQKLHDEGRIVLTHGIARGIRVIQ